MMDIAQIHQKLQNTLKPFRYAHTIGVAYTAASLAMCHEPGIMDKAFLAGLLHDCGKYLNDKENIDFCRKHGIKITEIETQTPGLIHAKIGEYLAKHEYCVDDIEILSAIRWHTTGRPDMTLLEKIVFISDYIEPARDHDPELPRIRQLAFTDMDACLRVIYEHTLSHLNNHGKKQDPMTKEAYEYYKNIT